MRQNRPISFVMSCQMELLLYDAGFCYWLGNKVKIICSRVYLVNIIRALAYKYRIWPR